MYISSQPQEIYDIICEYALYFPELNTKMRRSMLNNYHKIGIYLLIKYRSLYDIILSGNREIINLALNKNVIDTFKPISYSNIIDAAIKSNHRGLIFYIIHNSSIEHKSGIIMKIAQSGKREYIDLLISYGNKYKSNDKTLTNNKNNILYNDIFQPIAKYTQITSYYNEHDIFHIAIYSAEYHYNDIIDKAVIMGMMDKKDLSFDILLYNAAKGNNMYIIKKFLHLIYNPWHYIIHGASAGGHIELLEYSLSQYNNEYLYSLICLEAVEREDLNMLQLYIKNINKTLMGMDGLIRVAVRKRNIAIINCIIYDSYYLYSRVLYYAAQYGHFDILKIAENRINKRINWYSIAIQHIYSDNVEIFVGKRSIN